VYKRQGLYIHQDGVLASGKYALYVYSNAIQVSAPLVHFFQANASSSQRLLWVNNAGTGMAAHIEQDGVSGVNTPAMKIYSGAAQVNAPLLWVTSENAGSTAPVVEINNDGTGHGLYIHQDGVLATTKHGLYVYSDAINVNADSALVKINQDNASSTEPALEIHNDGSGVDIEKSSGDLILKDANAGTLTLTEIATTTITFIIDGGGDVITTGIKGDLEIPFACTIQQVTLLADQSGDIVVDIWKDSYANFPATVADTITAAAKPTIAAGVKDQDDALVGWTKTIAAGEILRFNIDSVTDIRRCTISLKIIKT